MHASVRQSRLARHPLVAFCAVGVVAAGSVLALTDLAAPHVRAVE
jgi:hypothetical protein